MERHNVTVTITQTHRTIGRSRSTLLPEAVACRTSGRMTGVVTFGGRPRSRSKRPMHVARRAWGRGHAFGSLAFGQRIVCTVSSCLPRPRALIRSAIFLLNKA